MRRRRRKGRGGSEEEERRRRKGGGREEEEWRRRKGGGKGREEEEEGRRRKGGGGREEEEARGKGGGGREEEEGRRKGGGGREEEEEGRRRRGSGRFGWGSGSTETSLHCKGNPAGLSSLVVSMKTSLHCTESYWLLPPLVVVSTRPLSTAQNPTGSSSCGGQHDTSLHCTESYWLLLLWWSARDLSPLHRILLAPSLVVVSTRPLSTAQNPAGFSSLVVGNRAVQPSSCGGQHEDFTAQNPASLSHGPLSHPSWLG
ncbi:hypothetical protein ACOMHN_067071 [Nucella lapillus]